VSTRGAGGYAGGSVWLLDPDEADMVELLRVHLERLR
jgi:hypothetical protein